jgi:hypothetical protein
MWIHYTLFDIYKYIFSKNYDLLPSDKTDGIVERQLNIDIEDSTEISLDKSPCKKSLESLFEEVTTPTKTGHQNEIARFYENTLSYISPETRKLHSYILKNSPENLSQHNNDTIQVSRKNMSTNINYIIDYGQLMNNPKAAKIFDDMEKICPRFKIKNTAVGYVWQTHPIKRRINWICGIHWKKEETWAQTKGIRGIVG